MGGVVQTNPWFRYKLPRLNGEGVDVCPGTPLALIGLWVSALRYRFNRNPAEPLPWVWDADLRPSDTEDGQPVDLGEPRKLLIEAAFNVEKSARNYRPAIYVDRGEVSVNKVVIDNMAGKNLPSGLTAYFCQAEVPIIFYCESENAAESGLIADTAFFFILATRDIFRKDFGLYDIKEPVLGKTQQLDEDKQVWQTPVQFSVTLEMRWTTVPIAPLLRDIALQIEVTGDANLYYHQVVLRDSGDGDVSVE
jgi:hypothetical protein